MEERWTAIDDFRDRPRFESVGSVEDKAFDLLEYEILVVHPVVDRLLPFPLRVIASQGEGSKRRKFGEERERVGDVNETYGTESIWRVESDLSEVSPARRIDSIENCGTTENCSDEISGCPR